MQKYTGESDPIGHMERCMTLWRLVPEIEWSHIFIHTLDTTLKNWYLELEMHKDTTIWEELTQRFEISFTFEHESPSIDTTLKEIQTKIFLEVEMMEIVPICSDHKDKMTVKKILECYNVTKEEYEEEDLRNVKIPEIEGICIVEGTKHASAAYTQPIKMKKVNIGTIENLNFE